MSFRRSSATLAIAVTVFTASHQPALGQSPDSLTAPAKFRADWQTSSTIWTDNKPLFAEALAFLARKNPFSQTETGGTLQFGIGQYAFNSQPANVRGQTLLKGAFPSRSALVQKYDQKDPARGFLSIQDGANMVMLENLGIAAAGNGGAAIGYTGTGKAAGGNLYLTNVRIGTADGKHGFNYGLYLDGCSANSPPFGMRSVRIVNLEIFSARRALAHFACLNGWSWFGGGAYDTAPGGSSTINILSTDDTPSANGMLNLPYARSVNFTAGKAGTYEVAVTVPHLSRVNFGAGVHHEISVTSKIDDLSFRSCACTHITINGHVTRLSVSGGTLTDVSINGNVGTLSIDGGTLTRLSINGSVRNIRGNVGGAKISDSTVTGRVGVSPLISGLRMPGR